MWYDLLSPHYTLNMGGHAPTYRERKPRGWTGLYHSGYLALTKVSYPIWREKKLDMPVWSSNSTLRGTAVVDYTNLVSAILNVVVTATVWPSWASLYFNGVAIADFDFRLGSGSATLTVDVTNLLVKGPNELLFDARKVSWVGWGEYLLTVDLAVEAETSSVSPPAPWETWPSWWPYAAAGAGMAAVGGVILLRKKR